MADQATGVDRGKPDRPALARSVIMLEGEVKKWGSEDDGLQHQAEEQMDATGKRTPWEAYDLYLPRLSCLFHAVEHGAELCQPLSVHSGHTLHVLLQAEGTRKRCSQKGRPFSGHSRVVPQLGAVWEEPTLQPREAEKSRGKYQTLKL